MNISKYNNYTTVIKIAFSEINKIDMALCKQPRETLESFYERQSVKPDVLINGGFFNMADGTTCFNYRDEEQQIHSTDAYQWGIGIIDEKTLKYGALNGRTDWRDFISGYPVLIDSYQKVNINFATELNYNARRSILAYDPNYVYIIAIDKPGMNFKAMQNMLVDLGVEFAINLDGGGSTRVLQNGKLITAEKANRPVDNVLAIYLNPEKEKAIYRVQLGCYSQRANAEKMLEQIKALGGIYEKAYIKVVNKYFKVQAGAFTLKDNAEKVKKDLMARGYNSFITN